jgi:hypothetical protein
MVSLGWYPRPNQNIIGLPVFSHVSRDFFPDRLEMPETGAARESQPHYSLGYETVMELRFQRARHKQSGGKHVISTRAAVCFQNANAFLN